MVGQGTEETASRTPTVFQGLELPDEMLELIGRSRWQTWHSDDVEPVMEGFLEERRKTATARFWMQPRFGTLCTRMVQAAG